MIYYFIVLTIRESDILNRKSFSNGVTEKMKKVLILLVIGLIILSLSHAETTPNNEIADDQKKLALLSQLIQEHEANYIKSTIYPRIQKEIFNQILHSNQEVKRMLNVTATTNEIAFFSVPYKLKKNQVSINRKKYKNKEEEAMAWRAYLANGYLPINSAKQLDFTKKACTWVSRKALCEIVFQSRIKDYSLEISRHFDEHKYHHLGFDSKQACDDWCVAAGERQLELGQCYYYGREVEKDATRAFKCYMNAANCGNATALANVGLCYYNGEGVEKRIDKAFIYFERSAKKECPQALRLLGLCYYHGQGTTMDKKKGVELWQKAANLGDALAHTMLGEVYDAASGENNASQAVKHFMEAAKMGEPLAQYKLAACYEYGHGITKDFALAKKWYKTALDNKDATPQQSKDFLEAYNDTCIKSLTPTDSIGDFIYVTKVMFSSFKKPQFDEWYLEGLEQINVYSQEHKDEYAKDKAMHQLMAFILLTKENMDLFVNWNNKCLLLDKECKTWAGYCEKWTDLYNDLCDTLRKVIFSSILGEDDPRCAAIKQQMLDISNNLENCKKELAKHLEMRKSITDKRDSCLQNATRNWNNANSCLNILLKNITETQNE